MSALLQLPNIEACRSVRLAVKSVGNAVAARSQKFPFAHTSPKATFHTARAFVHTSPEGRKKRRMDYSSSTIPSLNFNALYRDQTPSGNQKFRPPSGRKIFGNSPDVDHALVQSARSTENSESWRSAAATSWGGPQTERVVYKSGEGFDNSTSSTGFRHKVRARSAIVRSSANAVDFLLKKPRAPSAPKTRRWVGPAAATSRSQSRSQEDEDDGLRTFGSTWGEKTSVKGTNVGNDSEEDDLLYSNLDDVEEEATNNGNGKKILRGRSTHRVQLDSEDGKSKVEQSWVLKMEQLSRIVASIDVGSVASVVEKASTLIKKLLRCEACAFLLLNKPKTALYGYAADGTAIRFAVNRGIVGNVARSADSINSPDALNAPLSMYDAEIDGVALGCVIHLHYYTAVGFPAFLFLKRDQKMVEFAQSSYRVHPRAVCCVPMFVPGKLHNPAVFGVVIVANREPGVNAVFSVVDEAMLRMFGRGVASQLAASIEQEANNEKITRLLKLDDLTQILAAASSHRDITLALMQCGPGATGAGPDSIAITYMIPDLALPQGHLSSRYSHLAHTGIRYVRTEPGRHPHFHVSKHGTTDINSSGAVPPLVEPVRHILNGRALRAWESNQDSLGVREELIPRMTTASKPLSGPVSSSVGEAAFLIRGENRQVVAVLELAGSHGSVLSRGGFNEEDSVVLPRLVSSIATAMERIDMLERLTSDRTLVPGLAAVLDIPAAAKIVCDHSAEILRCPRVSLLNILPDRNSALVMPPLDLSHGSNPKTLLSTNIYPVCDAILNKNESFVRQAAKDLEFRGIGWPKLLGYKPSQMLVAPVFTEGRKAVQAVLMACHEDLGAAGSSGHFSKADVFTFTAICDELGPVMDKIASYEHMVQQNKTVTGVFHNFRDLFGDLDLGLVLDKLTDTARALLDCTAATIFLVEGLGTRERHGLRVMTSPLVLSSETSNGNVGTSSGDRSSKAVRGVSGKGGVGQAGSSDMYAKGNGVSAEEDITLYSHGGLPMRLKITEGFAGWCARTGKSVSMENPLKDDRGEHPALWFREGKDTRSIMCLPLQTGVAGVISGVVQVENKNGGHFTAEDEMFFSFFASMAAVAIETCGIYPFLRTMEHARSQVVSRHQTLLSCIQQVSEGNCTSLVHIHNTAVFGALKVTEANAAHVLLTDPESGERELITLVDGQIVKVPAPQTGFAATVLKTLQPVNAFPASTSTAYDDYVDPPDATTMAALAVPLFGKGGGGVGAMVVFRRRKPFEELDQDLLFQFGTHVVHSIEQLDLFARLAWMDLPPHPDSLELDPTFFESALIQGSSLCRSRRAVIFRVDHHTGRMIPLSNITDTGTGLSNKMPRGRKEKTKLFVDEAKTLRIGEGIAGRVAERGIAMRVSAEEAIMASMLSAADHSWAGSDPQSILCVPASCAGGKTELVLCFVGKTHEKIGGEKGFDVRDEVTIKVFARRLLSVLQDGEIRCALLRNLQRRTSLAQFFGREEWVDIKDAPAFAALVLAHLNRAFSAVFSRLYLRDKDHRLAVLDHSGTVAVAATKLPPVVDEVLRQGQICNQRIPAFADDVSDSIQRVLREKEAMHRRETFVQKALQTSAPKTKAAKPTVVVKQPMRSFSMLTFDTFKDTLGSPLHPVDVKTPGSAPARPASRSLMGRSPHDSPVASYFNEDDEDIQTDSGEDAIKMTSVLCAPIIDESGSVIGALMATTPDHRFSPEDEDYIGIFSAVVAGMADRVRSTMEVY